MQLRFFILVGCAYDLLGAQKAAVLGGLVSAVCNVLLAIAVRLDPQARGVKLGTHRVFRFRWKSTNPEMSYQHDDPK